MEDYLEPDNGLTLGDLILKIKSAYRYLLSYWIYLLVGGFVGASLGLVYAFSGERIYTAECTFVLEDDKGGGLGQMAGVASLVGIDLGGGNGNGLFQGDNIIELYKSRTMLKKVLLSEVSIEGKKQLLVERFANFTGLRSSWEENPRLANFKFDPKADSFLQDSVLFSIIKTIRSGYLSVAKLDKKLSIISVKLVSTDELFAKEFVNTIVANVNTFYIKYRTKKTSENLEVLKLQSDSVRGILNSSIVGAANAIDFNPRPNLSRQVLRTPSQRRQVDVQANSAIYAEVEKNRFLTQMSLMKETPLIQVIDKPELPLDFQKRRKLSSLLSGGFLGGFLMLLYIVMRDLFRNATPSGTEKKRVEPK